jgi:hypothetical protein
VKQPAVAPQDRGRVDPVLQDVAEQDAVERARLQRRVLPLRVQDKHPVKAPGGAAGQRRLALDAEDLPPRRRGLQGGPQVARAAADVQDAPGARGHGAQQGPVRPGQRFLGLVGARHGGIPVLGEKDAEGPPCGRS